MACAADALAPAHPACLPAPAHPAGEGEAEHRELVDFCTSFRFERMGCFQYSEEDGTPAAELPEQVGGSRGPWALQAEGLACGPRKAGRIG